MRGNTNASRFIFSGDKADALDVAIGPSGWIAVVGRYQSEIADKFEMVAMLLFPDGALDESFGEGGIFRSGPSDSISRSMAAVVFQSNRSLLIAGHLDSQARLFRLTRTGRLDDTFQLSGQVGLPTSARSLELLTSAGGGSLVLLDEELMHRNPDGGADDLGAVVTSFGHYDDRAYDVTVQKDGKIIVVGESLQPAPARLQWAAARYLPNGQLDYSFSDDGIHVSGWADADDGARAVALGGDGRIHVAAYTERDDLDFMYFSMDPDGYVRNLEYTDFRKGDDLPVDILVQPDGKAIIVGTADTSIPPLYTANGIALARYHRDGDLDTSFGDGGTVATDILLGGVSTAAHSALLLESGKILVAGTSGQDVLVVRYHNNGEVDTSFGNGGVLQVDNHSGVTDVAYGIGLISNDHIAIGAQTNNVAIGLLIIDPDGDPCTICGTLPVGEHYWRTVEFDGPVEKPHSLLVQDNGRILLAGNRVSDAPVEFIPKSHLSARFKPNSLIQGPGYSLDTSYAPSSGGKVMKSPGLLGMASQATALYGFGVYDVGYRFNGHDDDFHLMKLQNDSESYPNGRPPPELIFSDGFEGQDQGL